MALDTRRYQTRAAEQAPVSLSASALPGLIVLAVGVFIIITGIILLAAFGVPKDLTTRPEALSGAIVIGIGFVVCFSGVLLAMYLKKKARQRKADRQKQRVTNQRSQQEHSSHKALAQVHVSTAYWSQQNAGYSTEYYASSQEAGQYGQSYPDSQTDYNQHNYYSDCSYSTRVDT